MADLDTIPGVTETEPDTVPITERLVELLESRPGRSQDALADGIEDLERAYALESNQKVRSLIEEALDLLRHGPEDTAGKEWKGSSN